MGLSESSQQQEALDDGNLKRGQENASTSEGCPVKHDRPKIPTTEGCPVTSEGHPKSSGCPEKGGQSQSTYKHPHVFNVYSQRINPDNQMPANPNQKPHPAQDAPLSTNRVESTIPKGGTDSRWSYPSPQMFYNALLRKGKGDDVSAGDMDAVVAIHNNMNERTWKQLLQWEQDKCCKNPCLLRFQGRPNDLSPKAWVKSWLGYGVPFDRHDWFVDRCGELVRYVVDFYHVEDAVDHDQFPLLGDTASVRSVSVDVRPALDSFESLVDRARHLFSNTGTQLEPTPQEMNRPKDHKVELPELSDDEVREFVASKCASRLLAFKECGEDEEVCGKASVALNYCMGSVVCKESAEEFISRLEKGEPGAEDAYSRLTRCLGSSKVLKALFDRKETNDQ